MISKRLIVLKALEMREEKEISFFCSRFNNVSQIKKYESQIRNHVTTVKDPSEQPFSGVNVINEIQLIHARRHTSYSVVLDRKFLKLLSRRDYQRKNLYLVMWVEECVDCVESLLSHVFQTMPPFACVFQIVLQCVEDPSH